MANYDDLEWHREKYKIPAKKGMLVKVDEGHGIIMGSHGSFIRIKVQGKLSPSNYHPLEIEFDS